MTAIALPAFLQLSRLTDDDEAVRSGLVEQLRVAKIANKRQQEYYEGATAVKDLGIAIPPHLRDIEAVAAWPEIVVDVLAERLDWRGWYTPDQDYGLDPVFTDNHLGVVLAGGIADALICGQSFLTVGTGGDDEPEVLVTNESPDTMTAAWDARRRRVGAALAEIYDDKGKLAGWKIYRPGRTLRVELVRGALEVTDIDEHGRPRVPVSVLFNRPRGSRVQGRSEITRAVRSLTDSGMRTLLGMEIAREFYGAPQRYLMGAEESMFQDAEGKPVGAWAAIIGNMLMAPRDEEGELPVPGEFKSSSPQPFTELLRTYSQMISAATGVPAHHLGFTTDNPASADAIQRADNRLDRRAILRQRQFDLALVDLGQLCVLWRDGDLPEKGAIRSLWTDPSTPTPAASADRAVKMISAGVLDPSWDFTLEQFGLSDVEIKRVRQQRTRSNGREAIRALAASAPATVEADRGVSG